MARPVAQSEPQLRERRQHLQLVADGLLDPECERVFRVKANKDDPGSSTLTLHRHQREAVEVAQSGQVVRPDHRNWVGQVARLHRSDRRQGAARTSGERWPAHPRRQGHHRVPDERPGQLPNVRAEEVPRVRLSAEDGEPVRFARYTGQENEDTRRQILADPPDILLTNYVMLELVLTRPDERKHLIRAAQDLRFLVMDELHTYRGRQGADVALLIRRLRDVCASPDLQVIGTSATMASGGTSAEQKSAVADVAIAPLRFRGHSRVRHRGDPQPRHRTDRYWRTRRLGASVAEALARTGVTDYEHLARDPLAQWIEGTFGLATEEGTGRLVRSKPTTVSAAADQLAELSGTTPRTPRRRSAGRSCSAPRPRTPAPGGHCSPSVSTSSSPKATPSTSH